MQEESQESPHFESDGESQPDTTAQDETTQDADQ
jgi:hypothetical protein